MYYVSSCSNILLLYAVAEKHNKQMKKLRDTHTAIMRLNEKKFQRGKQAWKKRLSKAHEQLAANRENGKTSVIN